jgi:uroporphyrin-III C-methyltransferase
MKDIMQQDRSRRASGARYGASDSFGHPFAVGPGGGVTLVGAGPGDPDLITVAGLRALRRAEVLVYDRLVSQELVDECPADCERIYVGKAPGHHALAQTEINQLLVRRALRAQVEVRLKGGDPFVFGRGGEAAMDCGAAGGPGLVIPGISSAVAAPASACIPVTHRGVATSYAVVTAHRADGELEEDAWRVYAGIDTLVLLMGVSRLPQICAALARHGRHGDTPVAIVERGTLPTQRVCVSTLAEVVAKVAHQGIRSPATIVVGEVVRLRESLLSVSAEAAMTDQHPALTY